MKFRSHQERKLDTPSEEEYNERQSKPVLGSAESKHFAKAVSQLRRTKDRFFVFNSLKIQYRLIKNDILKIKMEFFKAPATEKQLSYISSLGFPYPEILKQITKIQASKIIGQLLKTKDNPIERKNYLQTFASPDILEGIEIYYTDGGTLSNGYANQQSYICVMQNDKVLIDRDIGNTTNNEAEFTAILETLKIITDSEKAVIFSDSKFTVDSLNLDWNLQVEKLIKLRETIYELWEKSRVKIEWIRRFHNKAGEYLERKYQV